MSLNFLTPADLEKALKKQFEDLHADFDKSQAKLFERIKKLMQKEIRQSISEVGGPLPTTGMVAHGDATPIEQAQNLQQRNGTTRANQKRSAIRFSRANPFMSINVKLNDADDLEPRHALREATPHLETITETPRSDQGTTQDIGKETDSGFETGGTARGLQMQAAEIDVAPGPLLEAPAGNSLGSVQTGEPNEPLLTTEIVYPEPTIDWIALLQNPIFEGVIVGFVILNSLWIGAELEHSLKSVRRPAYFTWVDLIFCILFSCELLFRISLLRLGFFDPWGSQCIWNYFDLVLVLSQIVEITFKLSNVHKAVNNEDLNMSWLRILRILRIVRLTRIVRTVRFIEGLRTLMKCLVRGMAATGWITLFLLMQIYTCSLAFTELLHDMRMNDKNESSKGNDIDLMFGSLLRTMGTLCKSITGGIPWDNALEALNEVSTALGFAFVIYVSFSLLVILNVFTGFFVNTSSMCADEDSKVVLRDRVADIFVIDENNQKLNIVDEDLFTARVNSPEMKSYLNQIDLHVDEADGLFKILDINGDGKLDPIQIVSGLMRMRGSAKALDIRILMYMITKVQEINHEHMSILEDQLWRVNEGLASLRLEKTEADEPGRHGSKSRVPDTSKRISDMSPRQGSKKLTPSRRASDIASSSIRH